MVSMYLLIPLSLMLFVVGIWAVRFAVKSNQFEDLDNAAQRVILDDRQERRQALSEQNMSELQDSLSVNNQTTNQAMNQNMPSKTSLQDDSKV